jgi:hypothetical protein
VPREIYPADRACLYCGVPLSIYHDGYQCLHCKHTHKTRPMNELMRRVTTSKHTAQQLAALPKFEDPVHESDD